MIIRIEDLRKRRKTFLGIPAKPLLVLIILAAILIVLSQEPIQQRITGGIAVICIENWERVSEWSFCVEGEEQTAIFEDKNNCSENNTLTQTRNCCIEEWSCSWSKCVNRTQKKKCVDLNNCDTDFFKPLSTERDCKFEVLLFRPYMKWILLVISLLIIIVSIALYRAKRRKKSGIKEEKGKEKGKEKKKKVKPEKTKFPELKKYIEEAIKSGHKKPDIRKKLIGEGWSEKAINEAFKALS